LRTITHPKARHGFDVRGLSDRTDQPSGAPGYNADAANASWAAVLDLLKETVGRTGLDADFDGYPSLNFGQSNASTRWPVPES
jgi:hypothetical protein